MSGVCALVAEDYPSAKLDSQGQDKIENNKNTPLARLTCPSSTVISAVKFASFGTPTGTCGSYLKGDCHDPNSSIAVEKVCIFVIYVLLHLSFLLHIFTEIFFVKICCIIKGYHGL